MTHRKNTTWIVGYIAVLMIAGAGLGNPSHSERMGDFRSSAVEFRSASAFERTAAPERRVTVEMEGRRYEAVILREIDGRPHSVSTY